MWFTVTPDSKNFTDNFIFSFTIQKCHVVFINTNHLSIIHFDIQTAISLYVGDWYKFIGAFVPMQFEKD